MRGKLAGNETGYERCGRYPVPLFGGRLRGRLATGSTQPCCNVELPPAQRT